MGPNGGPILWMMFVLVGTGCLAVLGIVAAQIVRGESMAWLKPIRGNLIHIASLAMVGLLFVGLNMFEWMSKFVPESLAGTEFWGGAQFMAVLIAIIGIAIQLIAIIHTIVSALTHDPPDKPADHVAMLINSLGERAEASEAIAMAAIAGKQT